MATRVSAFLVIVLGAPAAFAESGTAVLTGVVEDAARKPMESVVVVATSPSLQGEQICAVW